MRKTIMAFMVLLALLLAFPWVSHAGHGHYGRHHHGNSRIFVGGSFWFGPPPFWGPPAWGPRFYYGAPVYYGPPPVIVPQPPVVYIQPPQVYVQQRQAEADYWHYCDNPQGFYPYIKSCPGGWMKVVPETVPPNR